MPRNVLDLGSWIILRMASGDTLRVARSLSAAGLTVWTPVERKKQRMKLDRSRIVKETALMPSYVFGRAEHLTELVRLEVLPTGDHPRFSVFRYLGGVPLIADEQLAPVREAENESTAAYRQWLRRGKKAPVLEAGTEVRATEGGFAGMGGVVEGQRGQYTLVTLDLQGGIFQAPLKVASILLDGSCHGAESVAREELPSSRAA